jgi:hypothetical protein
MITLFQNKCAVDQFTFQCTTLVVNNFSYLLLKIIKIVCLNKILIETNQTILI